MKQTLLIALLLISTTLTAQISFGLKAGASFSNTKIDNVSFGDPETKISGYAGVFSEYKFSKYAIDLSLTYNSLGNKRDIEVRDNPDAVPVEKDFGNNISQITITPTFKYYLIERLNIKAGGYLGIVIDTTDDLPEESIPVKYETLDYGLTIGAEFMIYKGLFVEASYNYGLCDIANFDESRFDPEFDPIVDGGAEHPNYKSRFLLIGIGYKF